MNAIDYSEGTVILIDKPYRWTSFDVIKKIRNVLKVKKIGHAGTLDPLATGLLIVCTGKMTKKINEYQVQEKEYVGELILGKTTPSYDLETAVEEEHSIENVTHPMLAHLATQFTGTIIQKPPIYSAIKIDGQKLYNLARRGETIDIKHRKVTIHSFEILRVELPLVEFKVVCSKGTYIRSLVHDFGKAAGTGAVLSTLRRTRIGKYSVIDAMSPQAFAEMQKQQRF
jgi:tRNA pseudouridine55 synthase